MPKNSEFPFESARRITDAELRAAEQAVQEQFDIDIVAQRGRPPKPEDERYEAISIRLHPKVIAWAKVEAEKRAVGYQTVINEELLKLTS
jgi:uncharacterized protein (DUF4415 family)